MMEKSLIDNFNQNYAEIKEKIALAAKKSGRKPEDIKILAATKTVSPELINYAIESGIEYIGENKVQEFLSKNDLITNNVHCHFIGHLQTNKVKDIVGKVELIQSVDSIKLATVIGNESIKKGIITDILLEVNVAGEESKSGFRLDEVYSAFENIEKIEGVRIKGFMTIPPICNEKTDNIRYFNNMQKLFIDIGTEKVDNNIKILSMGMSDDYDIAVECGATMVRIGTSLFGKRNYK